MCRMVRWARFQTVLEEMEPQLPKFQFELPRLQFDDLPTFLLPPEFLPSPEALAEGEEFMEAYHPYHDRGDETLLWQWVERKIGRKPDPLVRARLWFDYKDLVHDQETFWAMNG